MKISFHVAIQVPEYSLNDSHLAYKYYYNDKFSACIYSKLNVDNA